MHLTEAQFDILRAWAQHTAQVKEAYLFGSYVKGAALAGSDVDCHQGIRNRLDLPNSEMGRAPNESNWDKGQHPYA